MRNITMEDTTGQLRKNREIIDAIKEIEKVLVGVLPPSSFIPLFMSLTTIRDALLELLVKRNKED